MTWWTRNREKSEPVIIPPTPEPSDVEFKSGYTCPNYHSLDYANSFADGTKICPKCGAESKEAIIKTTFTWGRGYLAGFRLEPKPPEHVRFLDKPKPVRKTTPNPYDLPGVKKAAPKRKK